jgi:hypothetical protein
MPTVKRPKLRKAAKRFDPAALRELVDEGRVHAARALVVQEGSSHFEIVDGGADVLVDVEIQPSGVRCTARLGGLGGGPGRGIWAIPPVGAEVVLLVPDGELEAGAVIVACESTGAVPSGLDATTYVICAPAGGKVLVHDGSSGDAVPLATKADVDALKATLDDVKIAHDTHVHVLTIAAASGSGGTGTAAPPVIKAPTPPAMSGTSVLRAK